MDIAYFLNRRLDFIKRFYDTAATPFETTKDKIYKGEEPFLHQDPEGGPEYGHEFSECESSLYILGHCCLSLVKSSLEWYLDRWVKLREDMYPTIYPDVYRTLREKLREQGKRGWFGNYQGLFMHEFGIDWKTSPVQLNVLEEMVQTRDHFEHRTDLAIEEVRQSDKYFGRFPKSIFADDVEVEILADAEPFLIVNAEGKVRKEQAIFPWRLKVDRAKLDLALGAVKQFCNWLEHWSPPKKT